ncbi:MAG: class I SAM-dependent methyltransferase [Candidatus Amesbacteria bacterium]|nr:class I SAM-dependent methyltransferase [Candidatus Amesbacteria bacterium]
MNFYDNFHHGIKIQKKVIPSNNFTYRHTIATLAPLISGNKKTILDYGCGVGTIDFYLASKGCSVLGVEMSKKAIDACNASSEAIGVSTLAKFDSINKKISRTFDIVICSEVIEHVPKDMNLLIKLSKNLKKGGDLVVTTPSVNSPLYRLGLANEFDKRVGHLRRYNSEDLANQIKSIGFKINNQKKEEGILRNSLFLFPFLGWIIRFLKGPLSDIVTFIDDLLVVIFGESDIVIVAQKI